MIANKGATVLNLSEQQLVDCSTANGGCTGGERQPTAFLDWLSPDGRGQWGSPQQWAPEYCHLARSLQVGRPAPLPTLPAAATPLVV